MLEQQTKDQVTKNTRKGLSSKTAWHSTLVVIGIAFLSACSGDGGGDGDNDDKRGYIKLYNTSADSPGIFLTLDEDLEEDDEDEFEQTFSAVQYGNAGNRIALEPQDYFLELAWQDEDSAVRSDLEIVYEQQIEIERDVTQWVVMSDSVESPRVDVFSIPDISDDEAEDDQDNDLFNLRFVNLHNAYPSVDVYLSENDETFNEAALIASLPTFNLSENFKFAEDQYKLYVTASGSSDVLFSSDEINYAFGGQYLIAVRENQGFGGSPFVVDNISNGGIARYDALESLAMINIYNGLDTNDLLPSYQASIDISIDGVTDIPDINGLSYGDFSDPYQIRSGDYRLTISNPEDDSVILRNSALSIPQNTNRTFFLYWTEQPVDDDGDGDFDENDDGQVDETRLIISSEVVNNSDRLRLYDKELTLLNLVTTDEFDSVVFYFVKSDEIIATAENRRNVVQGNATSLVLRNNTYQLFVVASIDNNDIIIDEQVLTLSETSTDLFLVLEKSDDSGSGYAVRVINQLVNNVE